MEETNNNCLHKRDNHFPSIVFILPKADRRHTLKVKKLVCVSSDETFCLYLHGQITRKITPFRFYLNWNMKRRNKSRLQTEFVIRSLTNKLLNCCSQSV